LVLKINCYKSAVNKILS